MKRQLHGKEIVTDWFTHDQLVAFYHNETVARDVEASRTSEEVRANPLAPECQEARRYKVTISMGYSKEENEKTHGFSLQGQIDKESEKAKEALDAIGEYFDSSKNSGASSLKDPAQVEKEKEEQQKALEAKKLERLKKLETDFGARASAWLSGINKDLGRLGDALASVAKAQDRDVKATWKGKFESWHKDITDFRKVFE